MFSKHWDSVPSVAHCKGRQNCSCLWHHPQWPDSTEVATPGEDAVPETGSRTNIDGAETCGRGGMRVEGSAAQVMACTGTQLWLSTKK